MRLLRKKGGDELVFSSEIKREVKFLKVVEGFVLGWKYAICVRFILLYFRCLGYCLKLVFRFLKVG